MNKSPRYLQALPSYPGGKRRLLAVMQRLLDMHLSPFDWQDYSLVDAFMGGGAVSLWAKRQGVRELTSIDISHRSTIIAEGLLLNSRQKLSLSQLTRMITGEAVPTGMAAAELQDVFSERHAHALDSLAARIATEQDQTLAALMTLLLWRLANESVGFSTTMGRSNKPLADCLNGSRSWSELSAKRYVDGTLVKLLRPPLQTVKTLIPKINAGVFPANGVRHYQGSALDYLPRLSADMVYLDPPYAGTGSYERAFHVIDSLLAGKVQDKASPSQFSTGLEPLHTLLESVQHIPIWLLSYGNHLIGESELVALVKQHAGKRQVVSQAVAYRHMPHMSKRAGNQELLVLAYPAPLARAVA